MSNVTDHFIEIFNLEQGDRQKNYGYFEGFLSITINTVLFVFKFILGTILNSVALIADSFHTLSDVVTSVVVVFGFKVSSTPADSKHPFGHGRAERIASVIIALLLVFVGIEFFISSYNRLLHPIPIQANIFVIAALAVSIFFKELLFHVSFDLGERIDSASLKADAWHHRSDSIATALIVAGFILYKFGLFFLDGILGMIISVLIAYTGISIIKESGSFLMGEAPSDMLVGKIKSIALRCDGIYDVHHIHVHDYGRRIEITLHIRLSKDTHLDEAHKKASEVEQYIRQELTHADVTVHVEPEFE